MGSTVLYSDPIDAEPVDQLASITELVADMAAEVRAASQGAAPTCPVEVSRGLAVVVCDVATAPVGAIAHACIEVEDLCEFLRKCDALDVEVTEQRMRVEVPLPNDEGDANGQGYGKA